MEQITIRAVVFQQSDRWVAQCLEYDIGAQASDLAELNVRLETALEAELKESMARHGRPFAGIDPAPKYFQEMWERRSGLYTPDGVEDGPSGDGHKVKLEFALAA